MTISQSFYAWLAAQSAVTAIAQDISPGSTPQQAARPAVTFSIQDDQDTELLYGVGSASTALMDVDCWAARQLTAESLATAIKAALDPFRTAVGAMGSHTVTHVRKTRELHLEENDTGLRRVSLQFEITYGD